MISPTLCGKDFTKSVSLNLLFFAFTLFYEYFPFSFTKFLSFSLIIQMWLISDYLNIFSQSLEVNSVNRVPHYEGIRYLSFFPNLFTYHWNWHVQFYELIICWIIYAVYVYVKWLSPGTVNDSVLYMWKCWKSGCWLTTKKD